MSWPSTDFELEIQNELDELRALKAKFDAWKKRPKDSREAVLKELQDTAKGWKESAYNKETRADARTMQVVCDLLTELDRNVQGGMNDT